MSDDKIPTYGQPLATLTLLENPPRVALANRPSRVALIHRMMVQLTPCLASAVQVDS
jgi:hypothetical protein